MMSDTGYLSENNIDLLRVVYFNHKKIREISLSKRQADIIGYFKGRKATSRDISNKYGISVENSSQQLKSLFVKGYLTREEVRDETGGYIFVYTSRARIFECLF